MNHQEIALLLGNAKCNMIIGEHSSLPVSSHFHVHPSFELFFVWKGEVQIKTENGAYSVGERQAALVAPTCYHQTFTAFGTEKFDVRFSLTRTKRNGDGDVYGALTGAFSGIEIYHISDAEEIENVIAALREIRMKECFCREERLKAELTKLLLFLYDIMSLQSNRSTEANVQAENGINYGYEIDLLINKNYAEDIDLEFLSKTLYLSPKRVSVLIKTLYGKSFREVRTEMRVHVAKQLLKESELPVSQIAEKVGYSTSRGFLIAFERVAGCTPSEYRNCKKTKK